MPTDTAQAIASTGRSASETQTLVAVSSAHLISHFYIMVVPVLMLPLKERLGVSFLDIGLALTIFNIVTGLTQAPMGFVVDRLGPRPVLIAGLVLGGLSFLLLGLASSYAGLLAVAVLAGLANCVYHPADYAMLADGISEHRIGRAFSVHTFAGFLGGAVAPPILLGLTEHGGLKAALVFAGLAGLATAGALFVTPGRSGSRHRARSTPATAPANVGNGVANVLTPAVLGLTVFFTLFALGNSAVNSFAVVSLMASQGVSFAAANMALTAYLAGSAMGVLVGGALADRTRRHGIMAASGFGLAAFFMLPVAALTLPVPAVVLAMGLSGVIFGLILPARDMLVRRAAPQGAVGRVFGIVSTGLNIGNTVGPLTFGWMMDHGSPRSVLLAAVTFMTLTALYGAFEEYRGARRAGALPVQGAA